MCFIGVNHAAAARSLETSVPFTPLQVPAAVRQQAAFWTRKLGKAAWQGNSRGAPSSSSEQDFRLLSLIVVLLRRGSWEKGGNGTACSYCCCFRTLPPPSFMLSLGLSFLNNLNPLFFFLSFGSLITLPADRWGGRWIQSVYSEGFVCSRAWMCWAGSSSWAFDKVLDHRGAVPSHQLVVMTLIL